ncbi:MAG: membrane protein [Candidatus Neomarinimicrobiota bacterium]|nr:MAG: membrane protein [Candidatus Neomarinimicrobiota bacterium]
MGLEFYSSYNWIKTFHIIFMVAWMAGLLYVPRLFVYHKENYENHEMSKVFKVMEKRLYFYIATPSLFIVWLTGLLMGNLIGFDIWLIIKIGFVILLSLYHVYIGLHLNRFKNNQQERTAKFFRLINEIPFVLLLLIVILVVFKPFY